MSREPQSLETNKRDFSVGNLDLSQLVGFQLKVFSDQIPGKEINARVVASTENNLVVEAGQQPAVLDNLVSNQSVVMQFPYRGQEISVRARLKRASGGSCVFELDQTATPLSQRRYQRVSLNSKVTLAPFPASGIQASRLGKLRWMETGSVNFSAGGALIELPTRLDRAARLLMNFDQETYDFPTLILAKVRHSYHADERKCHIGVEFIIQEQARRLFSQFQIADMPSVLFSYTNARREQLNRVIRGSKQTITNADNAGEKNGNF